jgi:hypothetical protein
MPLLCSTSTLNFPAQQQWKFCSQFPFPNANVFILNSVCLLAFFYSDSEAPYQQPPRSNCHALQASWQNVPHTTNSVQSSPDVIQFELESYNSYSRETKRFFFLFFCFGILKRSRSSEQHFSRFNSRSYDMYHE